jgi:hypothetical protein
MRTISRNIALGVPLTLLLTVVGCTGGSSLSDACNTTRQEFYEYMDHQVRANNAFARADSHWSDIYNASTDGNLSEEALALGAAALDADLDRAVRQEAQATSALQRYRAARQGCGTRDLPDGCQAEFRQYRLVIEHNQQVRAAQEQLTAAVTTQRNALIAGDVDTANAATARHNAANDELARLTDVYNNEILPAYDRAQDRCDAI